VVDAKHIAQHLDEEKPDGAVNESIQQIAFADRILLNKVDLVSQAELSELEIQIGRVNNVASCVRTEYSRVEDLKHILNVQAFDVDTWTNVKEGEGRGDANYLKYRPHRTHDATIGSVCLAGEGALDKKVFDDWLCGLLKARRADILRTKALIHIHGQEQRYVYQGVHDLLDSAPRSEWDKDEKRFNRILFIGRNLDGSDIAKSFEASMNPEWATTPNGKKARPPIYLTALSGPGAYQPPPPAANILGLLLFAALLLYFLYFGIN